MVIQITFYWFKSSSDLSNWFQYILINSTDLDFGNKILVFKINNEKIYNSAPIVNLMAAHNHVMKKFGYAEKKLSDIKSLAGKGAWVMMQRSFKEEIKDEKIKKEMTKEFLIIMQKILIKTVSH